MRGMKIVGLVVAWLALVGYFTYLRFPYEKLRPRIADQLASVRDTRVDFASVGPDGLGGLKLRDVTVERGAGDETLVYRLDRVSARPHLLSLVRGRPGVRIGASGYGGQLSGVVATGEEGTVRVDLGLDDVDLTDVPMPGGGSIQGTVDATLDDLVVVPGRALQGVSGRVEIEAREGAVLPFKTRTTRIPPQPVRFDRLVARADLEAGQAVIEELDLAGPDVSANGEAEITLSTNVARSRVTGELKVKFGTDFAVYEDVVVGLTRARKDSDGYLTLPLRGTLARPM